MLTFLVLGATGLSRMYMLTDWGRFLNGLFGGYESALRVHIFAGISLICLFLIHVLYVLTNLGRIFSGGLFGPDSLMPGAKDIKHFFQHVGWFLGLSKNPRFDRWTYWEKFDYWAVFWGMVVLGVTGLLMAFPYAATRYIPGWGLNVALWVHRIEALLAMAHVFMIHFFIAHLRRHNFPMDRTMFEGSSRLDTVRHEKPAWISRLEDSGKLEDHLVVEGASGQRIIHYLFGYAVVIAGLFLLIGALVNSPYISW